MNARRRGVGGPGRSGAEGGDPHELLVLEAQRLQVRGLARPERVELRTMGRRSAGARRRPSPSMT